MNHAADHTAPDRDEAARQAPSPAFSRKTRDGDLDDFIFEGEEIILCSER